MAVGATWWTRRKAIPGAVRAAAAPILPKSVSEALGLNPNSSSFGKRGAYSDRLDPDHADRTIVWS